MTFGDLRLFYSRSVKNLSLHEFWWKYNVYKGKVRPGTQPVCLMVTPAFSAARRSKG